jgi:multidrug efflux pump subunit AcrA (membrane-fusion protein)
LRPGMSVNVEVTAKTVKDAIAVPTGAVYKNPEGAYYVLLAGTDQKAHQKVVQLGVKSSELTQIASGIGEGDPVISSGGYAIPDGTAIQIEKPSVPEKGETETPAAKPDPQKKKTTTTPAAKDKE